MTFTKVLIRVVSALLALALFLGGLLTVVEIVLAALGQPPWVVPHQQWRVWLTSHSWNDAYVVAVLAGLVVVGLLLLLVALRPGRPATLRLPAGTEGVKVVVARRSVEKSLEAVASRTAGITRASAAAGRRTVRVKAHAVTATAPDLRQDVRDAVGTRVRQLGLADRMRIHVRLVTKDAR